MGKVFGVKCLVSRHHQKIKPRFLRITQKKIFADVNAQNLIHTGAGFNRCCRRVIDPAVRDIQLIQQIIDSIFPRRTGGFGPALVNDKIQIQSSSFIKFAAQHTDGRIGKKSHNMHQHHTGTGRRRTKI